MKLDLGWISYANKRIILFGSFARGDAGPKSDIDLAFDFEENGSQWTEFKLWVDTDFKTLRQIDMVDMKTADKSMLESIDKEGVFIYER